MPDALLTDIKSVASVASELWTGASAASKAPWQQPKLAVAAKVPNRIAQSQHRLLSTSLVSKPVRGRH
jgi:hypothetical protein